MFDDHVANGVSYLVVEWPSEGKVRLEEFVETVMPTVMPTLVPSFLRGRRR